jgi:hypothetical protein
MYTHAAYCILSLNVLYRTSEPGLPDFLSDVPYTIALKRVLIEKYFMKAAARAVLSCGSSCD